MTIQTILGCCEQCGSWTRVHVLVLRDHSSEERVQCYCGECLGKKKGVIPESSFIDINATGEGFRPGFTG